jgi:hypothetical protein
MNFHSRKMAEIQLKSGVRQGLNQTDGAGIISQHSGLVF